MSSRHSLALVFLLACAGAQAGPTIFAAKCCNSGSTVSVIDTSTSTLSSGFPAGSSVTGLVFSPDGTKAYLADAILQQILVLNVANDQVTSTISLGGIPGPMAISSDGSVLYAASGVDIAVINTSSGQITSTIRMSASAGGMVITPGGKKLYVTNNVYPPPPPDSSNPSPSILIRGGVTVVNTSTNRVTKVIQAPYTAGAMAMAPNGKHVYFVTPGGLYVIDTSLDLLPLRAADIPYATCVAISPDGLRAYVGDGNNTVAVVTLATNTVTSQIPVSSPVTAIAVTQDGGTVYAASSTPYGATPVTDFVAVINTSTLKVTGQLFVGDTPSSVAIAPDGKHAYVTNSGPSQLVIADGASAQVTAVNSFVSEPWSVALAPSLNRLYVSNEHQGTVSVINSQTYATVATIGMQNNAQTENYPTDLVVSPDGSYVYVLVNHGPTATAPTINQISTATNTIVNTLSVGANGSLVLSADGTRLYVTTDYYTPGVLVVNTATLTQIDSINLPDTLYSNSVAVTPDGSTIYVTAFPAESFQNGVVYAIDTSSKRFLATLPVGTCFERVTITPDGSQAWIADADEQKVLIVNTATNTMKAPIVLKGGPSAIAFSADGTTAYATEGPQISCVSSTSPGSSIAIINVASTQVTGSIPIGGAGEGIVVH